jgi:hypothetical protein
MILTLMPDLNRLRDAANFLRYQSLIDFDQNRQDAALDRLAEVEPIAQGAASHRSLVGYLVGIGCRAMQAYTLADFLPELRIGAAPGEVRPEQAGVWIHRLLDERQSVAEMHAAYRAERVSQLDAIDAMFSGRINRAKPTGGAGSDTNAPSAVNSYAIRPLMRENAIIGCDTMTQFIANLNAPDWPTCQRQIAGIERVADIAKLRPWNFMVKMMLPALGRSVEANYRSQAERRLVAAALAARWYAVEHDGQLPPTLDALVPKYLPAVPLDPMAVSQPLQYRPDAAMLYSVGLDGVDGGGDVTFARPMRGQDSSTRSWNARDFVLPLRREPRVFCEAVQFELDWRFDEPLPRRAPPAALPAVQGEALPPPLDDASRFSAWRFTDEFPELRTLRDVRTIFDDMVLPAAPATAPAAHAVLGGLAGDDRGTWYFLLLSDRRLLLTDPDGCTSVRELPATEDREEPSGRAARRGG